MQFVAYWDTWETGERRVINIPMGIQSIPREDRVTVHQMEVMYPGQFDRDFTMWCKYADSAVKLADAGFTNIISSDFLNRKLYISLRNYIVLDTSGIKCFMGTTRVAAYSVAAGTVGITGPGILVTDPSRDAYYSVWSFWENNTVFTCQSNGSTEDVRDFWTGATPYVPPVDPYDAAGKTGTGGGDGSWTITSDPVDFPVLPTATLSNAGFVSLWTPTEPQLRLLSAWMWNSDILTTNFWKKLFNSPLELVLGLSIIPYDLRAVDSGYTVKTSNLVLGYADTELPCDYIDEQFIEVDMGSVDLSEYSGSYLDYNPYTRISIYLPYIGAKDISADDCMNKKISLKYRIDIASGACVAIIKCSDFNNGPVDSVFYQFSGNCAAQIPITASQQQEVVRSIVSIGVGVASGVATGTAAGLMGAVGSTASGALGLKSHYGHSGIMGSTAGFLGVQTPYLIFSRPRLAIPDDQNVYMGYPAWITETLGNLSGYTEVEVTHLDRMTCTEEEMAEIARLLRAGVFF